jgi:hypothetical protein
MSRGWNGNINVKHFNLFAPKLASAWLGCRSQLAGDSVTEIYPIKKTKVTQ